MKRLGIEGTEKNAVRSIIDLISLSKKGLPKKSISKLEEDLSIKTDELALLLMISKKTLSRYKSGAD
ncbi:MAG: antitoxin Xre-like helix-turn-helix domain-containing protein, partial [Syntrophales bacterium]